MYVYMYQNSIYWSITTERFHWFAALEQHIWVSEIQAQDWVQLSVGKAFNRSMSGQCTGECGDSIRRMGGACVCKFRCLLRMLNMALC